MGACFPRGDADRADCERCVRILLADARGRSTLDARNDDGETALILAATRGHLAVVQARLSRSKSPSRKKDVARRTLIRTAGAPRRGSQRATARRARSLGWGRRREPRRRARDHHLQGSSRARADGGNFTERRLGGSALSYEVVEGQMKITTQDPYTDTYWVRYWVPVLLQLCMT